MQLVTRWQTVPRVAPLVVALALLLVLLAAALLLAGGPRLRAPFGPAANGLIAYMSGPQVVVAPVDGADPRPITPAADVAGEPVFSPLGRRIAYKLYASPKSPARSVLFTADLETGTSVEVHPIVPTLSTPSLSPDEQFLVFSQPTSAPGATGSSSSMPTPRLRPGRSARTGTQPRRCSHPMAGRSRSS